MKLHKKLKVTLLITVLFIMNSCHMNVTFFPYSFAPNVGANAKPIATPSNYERVASFTSNYRDVLLSNTNNKDLPLITKGAQKLLVLPVNFVDYDLNALDKNNGETAHIHLQNSFFGRSETTRWHSVSSFYHASSYGALKLSGEVAPWYTLPEEYSLKNIRARVRNNSDKINETARIVNLALRNYEARYPNKINEFDADNDGIIDSIYIVYSAPYETKETNNVFWAFAAYSKQNDSSLSKQAKAFAWSSYHYLDINRFQKPDPHTFIHEVGHLLGLSDYYNTNYNETYNALGGFDLMDYTLGDHSGLSKMLLNWTTPYIVKADGEVKLRPFVETGDLLLLNKKWNGSATDEYILIEYYTPTGLNEKDSNLNASFKLPKRNGLKVYHVDARTVNELRNGSITTYVYSNDGDPNFNGTKLMAHSNTTGSQNSAPMKDNTLYKLIEPSERTNISEDHKLANMFSLFTANDDFGINYFQDFTFNDGTKLGYTFNVKDITRDYATLVVREVV